MDVRGLFGRYAQEGVAEADTGAATADSAASAEDASEEEIEMPPASATEGLEETGKSLSDKGSDCVGC